MALLQKIRNRTGLLIFIVGLAMVSFILFDLAKNFLSPDYKKDNLIGKVDDFSINFETFNQKYIQIKNNYAQQNFQIDNSNLMNITWEKVISDIIINKKANDLGIIIPSKLLLNRLSQQPFIKNMNEFKDEKGNFNSNKLISYINRLKDEADSRYWNAWSNIIEDIELSTKQEVYNNFILDGILLTSLYAETYYEEQNTKIDLDYLTLPYSSIDNSKIEVSDKEIKDYIDSHKKDFIIEENRDLQIIAIERKASDKDYDVQYEEINSLKEDLLNTKNDSIFVNSNSYSQFDRNYYHKNSIKEKELREKGFKMKKGEIHGPYKSSSNKEILNISKLIDIKTIPDSVSFSQILITHNESNFNNRKDITKQRAKKISDSLFSQIKKDKSIFNKMVDKFSDDDFSKKNKGSIGWINFGKVYSNINDFCFFNKPNNIALFETPIGYHIIRIDEQKNFGKALKFATITKNIYPSENTEDSLYAKSNEIANKTKSLEDLTNIAAKLNLEVKTLEEIKKMDYYLTGIGENREIIKWSFDKNREYGDLKIFDTEKYYLIAFLSSIVDGGVATVEEAKYKVYPILLRDKKYKILSKKLSSKGKNLNEVSKKLGVETKSSLNISLNKDMLTGSGKEPKVVGASLYNRLNNISGPIKGNQGAFIITTNKRTAPKKLKEYSNIKNSQRSLFLSTIGSNMIPLLKETYEIKDNRHLFY